MQSNEAICATNMTPERWQQVKEIFNSAIQYEPKGRAAFLSQECGGEEALRHEVESLLQSHDESNSFLEQPAVENAAEMLVNDQPQLSASQLIGHYEIIKLAGEGGMGEVYLAQDTKLGRIATMTVPGGPERDLSRLDTGECLRNKYNRY